MKAGAEGDLWRQFGGSCCGLRWGAALADHCPRQLCLTQVLSEGSEAEPSIIYVRHRAWRPWVRYESALGVS